MISYPQAMVEMHACKCHVMKEKGAVSSFVRQVYVLVRGVCYKQNHLICVRVQHSNLRMRKQRNSSFCSVFCCCFFRGPVAVLYMWSSECWAEDNNHSSLPSGCGPVSGSRSGTEHGSKANGAGALPAKAPSHCTWAGQGKFSGPKCGRRGRPQSPDNHTSLWWWYRSGSNHEVNPQVRAKSSSGNQCQKQPSDCQSGL